MPTRTTRQNVGEHHHSTQQKRAHVAVTSNFLLERVRANLQEAARVLPEWFYHWSIKKDYSCPCTEAELDSPDNCPLCFGVGVLPGYIKHGFTTTVAIHPNTAVSCVNASWDYKMQKSVPTLLLDPTALSASIVSEWSPIIPNFGLEKVFILSSTGAIVTATVDDINWYEVNDPIFLTAFKTASRIKFSVLLTRSSLSEDLPQLTGIIFRYQTAAEPRIRGDIPKFNFTRERDELGIVPILETYNLYLTYEPGFVKIGDFFEHINTTKRFRLVSEEPLQPTLDGTLPTVEPGSSVTTGGLIGNDIQVRLVQPDEPIGRIR